MDEERPHHKLGLVHILVLHGAEIDILEHPLFEVVHQLQHGGREANRRLIKRVRDDIHDHSLNASAVGGSKVRKGLGNGGDDATPEGIVEVMVEVGDAVADADHGGFEGAHGFPVVGAEISPAFAVPADAAPGFGGEVEWREGVHHSERVLGVMKMVGATCGHGGVAQGVI